MSFSDRPFHERFTAMGDLAESVYTAVKPFGETMRFGYRRPKNVNFSHFPSTVRHQPDFLTTSYLVEVMGLGKDGILKSMKPEKYEALKKWNKMSKMMGLLGLMMFIWNSHLNTFLIVKWSTIVDEVAYSKRKYGVQEFKDGNEYYRLDWDRLVERAASIGTWSDD